MINFEQTNESGSIRLIGEKPLLFEFRYSNRFYGECNFEAGVRVETNRGLIVRRDAIEVLSQELKRGTEENLVSSAHLFFTRAVQGYSHQRLCEESRIEEEGEEEEYDSLSWGHRFRSAVQKWRDQLVSLVHSLNLSRQLEVKNKQHLK